MKKLVICIGLATVAAYGVYYVANKKVEDKVTAALHDSSKSIGEEFKGVVSTNILLGTLEIKDFEVPSVAGSKGDLKVEGIQYYNQDRIFNENIILKFDNYKVEDPTFDLTSDNLIKISNLQNGEIGIEIESKIRNEKTEDKELIKEYLNQKLEINASSMGDTYDKLNAEITKSVFEQGYRPDLVNVLSGVSGATIKKIAFTLDNNKLMQKGVYDSIKKQYPDATDAEIKAYLDENAKSYINNSFNETNAKALNHFLDNEKSKLTFTVENKNNVSLMKTYQNYLLNNDPIKTFYNDYELKIEN